MRIRLRDTPDKVQSFAEAFRKYFDVVDESADYPDREPSKLVRRYLEIQVRAEAGNADAERDAVYRERAHLVALLAAQYPAGYMPDRVPGSGWRIVYVALPTGQCSWHISPDDWRDLFQPLELPVGTRWDGHTTEEKYRRIREHTAQVAQEADESYQAWADEGRASTFEHDPDLGKDLDDDEPPY